MGCPPDPFEVDMSRGNHKSVELKEKAESLIEESKKSASFLHHLCKTYQKCSVTLPSAEQLQKDAQRFNAEKLGDTFGWNDLPPNGYSDYPDMGKMYNYLNESEQYVKLIEVHLCIVRDKILKEVQKIPVEKLSVEEKNTFLKEKELHLLHRREDKQIKLAALESEIGVCRYIISSEGTHYTPEQKKDAEKKLESLLKEQQRIAAISDEELLNDRELF